MFFKKVNQITFSEHEIWSFQSLLQKYKQIAREYRFDVGKLKSSYGEKVLIKEYVDETGFYERLKGTKVNLCKI